MMASGPSTTAPGRQRRRQRPHVVDNALAGQFLDSAAWMAKTAALLIG
jgi:hypothetical protein